MSQLRTIAFNVQLVNAIFTAYIVGCSHALQNLPSFARGGLVGAQWRAMNRDSGNGLSLRPTQVAHWLDLPLDHFDASDQNMFRNKFYINDDHWTGRSTSSCKGILYMGGEGAVGGTPNGWVEELAKQFGAILVAIEHRFYGESIPGGSLHTSNLKYLTTEQALADVAALIDHMDKELLRTARCPSDRVLWVAVGGSYSGALSAWFRGAFPNHTVGSISSSGVVNAILDFVEFDEQVAIAIGPTCAGILRESTAAFEQELLAGGDRAKAAKNLFGEGVDSLADADFFYMLADSTAMADQYGNKDRLCSALEPFARGIGTSENYSDGAYVEIFGESVNAICAVRAWTFTPAPRAELYAKSPRVRQRKLMETIANVTIALWGEEFAYGCFYNTTCLRYGPWDSSQDMSRQWRWQKCTEMGFLQAAPQRNSLRSTRLDLPTLLQQCEDIFGTGQHPDTQATNARYGSTQPSYTNVFFSDFADDPWQDLHPPRADDPPALVECRKREFEIIGQWFQASIPEENSFSQQ